MSGNTSAEETGGRQQSGLWPQLKRPWHAMPTGEVAGLLAAVVSRGLSAREAGRRLSRYGPNQLRRSRAVPWWRVLAAQFKSLVVLLLVVAAVICFFLGDNLEALSVVVVILLNAGIGFATEYRASRAMEALQKLGAQDALVLRSGTRLAVPATDLVPGDVVILQEGQSVCADARVVESAELQVDEAPLTGESVPVAKGTDPLDDEDTPLAERRNMVFKGTHATSGNGVTLVIATGMATEIGHISKLVSETPEVETPIERRLADIGRRLVVLCLAVAAVVAVAGIIQGVPVGLMLEAAIALAVAAVPEGLPAVATITLAVGMWRMAKQNALIRRLPAVETLGSATCICTDKTGTLTRNEMTVTRIRVWERTVHVSGIGYAVAGRFTENGRQVEPAGDRQLRGLLKVAVLCNNATVLSRGEGDPEVTGDPTEVALAVAATKAGWAPDELRRRHPELKEFAFSSTTMMMATVNDGLDEQMNPGQGVVLCVKGSPEAVAERCSSVLTTAGLRDLTQAERERALEESRSLAAGGLRVLGVAFKPVGRAPAGPEEAYSGLTWLGLAGLVDPPREGVRQTVDMLTRAGVKTVMITGDHPATAARIAAELHIAPTEPQVLTGRDLAALSRDELAARLEEVQVFARVSPEQKVDVLEALQRRGEICAMLGDGVNDAIALKRADIGVAMGIKGTDVAKETADMLLLDDRFVTVGAAVHQGRIIYANIKKFVHYLFSCNLSEVATMLFATMLGEPLPLLPLQILWLNMVTDVFPALALALERGEADIMDRPPRPPESSLLDRRTVGSIVGYGLLITLAALTAFFYGRFVRGYQPVGRVDPAITMSFLTIGLAQLFHVFNSRKERGPLRGREWFSNPYVLGALVLTVGLQLAAVYMPGLKTVMRTSPPAAVDWLVIGACALMPLAAGQLYRRVVARKPASSRA